MADKRTNFSLSLNELNGWDDADPNDAPTVIVKQINESCKKPLSELSHEEIGRLVVQHTGYPYLLDLVWPRLQRDPLYEGGYYPGDVLSNLMRAEADIWAERPAYKAELAELYRRALERPLEENDVFKESLGLPPSGGPN